MASKEDAVEPAIGFAVGNKILVPSFNNLLSVLSVRALNLQ
jgi:hypothetical protein